MRFLLDNNLSPHLARALDRLSEPRGVRVYAIVDRFDASAEDAEWIGELAADGDWAIVSQDRFAKGSLEKEALRSSGLVVFILARGWSKLRYWDKAAAIVRWWPRMLDQAELVTGGAGFEVPVRSSGTGRFRLIKL